ncbi:MAG: PadR family transcriptional regulator [Candidatus Lokiarchaeota archaeon]|nr:PadR family transcriptional regulator [Candidatus Lokiarchaeota archaeon]
MFKRDIDQFRFDDRQHRSMGQGPPEHNGPPFPPLFGGLPFFGSKTPFSPEHLKPPIPIGREAFQEIRDFIVLLIISEFPDGITGYQLQEKYNFPRGTLIRTLQNLEEKKYLKSKEEIIEGRANKFYMITELGKKFIEELKLKWANLFSMMSEITPPNGFKMMIFEKIRQFETKDDAIDFFRGLRSWTKGMLQNIERRIENFKKSNADLDEIIKEIENMEHLQKDKIIDLVKETMKKMEDGE